MNYCTPVSPHCFIELMITSTFLSIQLSVFLSHLVWGTVYGLVFGLLVMFTLPVSGLFLWAPSLSFVLFGFPGVTLYLILRNSFSVLARVSRKGRKLLRLSCFIFEKRAVFFVYALALLSFVGGGVLKIVRPPGTVFASFFIRILT